MPRNSGVRSPLLLLPYEGAPPSDEVIAEQTGLAGADFTYLVATAALQGERRKLIPRDHPQQSRHEDEPQLVFHRALRLFLGRALLSRPDERIALQRAIEHVEPDAARARVLRHDVVAWRDALAELAQRGVDLTADWDEWQHRFVSPYVARTLRDLQAEFRRRQREHELPTFEEAAYRFLREEYEPTSLIVMEGFTFLTPLQRVFLEEALRRGARRICIVHPYSAGQPAGFALLDRTYAEHRAHGETRPRPGDHAETGARLDVLRRSLFAAVPPRAVPREEPGTPSVTMTRYTHPHREVEGVVRRIQEALDAGAPANEIAIVTRNAREYDTLLQEEASLQGLHDREGRSVGLSVPPRQLLLTPVGRFVLTLYQIWVDGALAMDPEAFETILASGWLGAHVQESTERFNAVRAQVFARSRTREEWLLGMERLRALGWSAASNPRVPGAEVDERTVSLWIRTLHQIEEVCRRLFSGPERSIGAHIDTLMDELGQLAPEQMREAEREVLVRVRAVLDQVGQSASLPMKPGEFGEVLNGLVREYERPVPEDTDPDPRDPTLIWVTTPEGVDGYGKRVVFFLGVDNARVPRASAEPWPLHEHEIDAHLDRERYMFLAVVRATRESLHLSYSTADERQSYLPSPYLQRAGEVLDLPVRDAELPAEPEQEGAEEVPQPRRARARRRHYRLSELAHFTLCPFRYKLERIDVRARSYRTDFQLRFLAQGSWLSLALGRLVETGRRGRSVEEVAEMFMEAVGETEHLAREMYPGLGNVAWQEVRTWVRRKLLQEAERHGEDYTKRVMPAVPAAFVLPGDRVVEVDASLRFALRKGRFLRSFDADLLHQEWLLHPGKPDDDAPEPYVHLEGVRVFSHPYYAVKWWADTSRAAFQYETRAGSPFADERERKYRDFQADLEETVAAVEQGHFPKNPGPQCIYCPVRHECLGLPERRTA